MFQQKQMVQDAVIRNIEIIGEAAGKVQKMAPDRNENRNRHGYPGHSGNYIRCRRNYRFSRELLPHEMEGTPSRLATLQI
jgi:hypothetical protein